MTLSLSPAHPNTPASNRPGGLNVSLAVKSFDSLRPRLLGREGEVEGGSFSLFRFEPEFALVIFFDDAFAG